MERDGHVRDYNWPVAFRVHEHQGHEYEAAADYLNEAPVDLVSIQHEFGIFGGPEETGLVRFLDRLVKPVVTTLHTVLPQPDEKVRESLRAIARRSQRLVVMNSLAVDILYHDYAIDRQRVSLIHHGALPPSPESREEAKERLGLSGRKILLTYGLVARGKGLEYTIAALPAIREHHPEVCYLIVGQTHPNVQQDERETYREALIRQIGELGLEDSVIFVNRYVSKAEIMRFLAATDVYVTPYINPHQITSGTLAYALASGAAIVSTPYLYARFLLDETRGLLVALRSAEGIASAVNRILDHPDLQRSLQRRARLFGQQMFWPVVGAHYLKLFRRVVGESAPTVLAADDQLELALPAPLERSLHHEPGRSRPAPAAGSLAAVD
jgi:glycosyltransferase involved in cell wall biosynthesis